MADHAKPILTDNYTDVLSQIRGRFEDQAKGFDPANTAATNISTGTIRWNSAEKKFQKWSGTAWGDLTDNYVLSGATFSTGTANGVAYLNGSKVLTTGSALWFDGTNFGVGTGGNTLNHQSVVYKVGANAVYQQVANGSTGLGATNGIRLGVSNGGTGELYSPTALISYIDNTEQMRLTSTGLGIGTSSPENLLQASARFGVSSSGIVRWGQTVTVLGRANSGYLTWDTGLVALGYEGAGAIRFDTNSLERMRLDSSGNVGIGTSSPSAALDIVSLGNPAGTAALIEAGTANSSIRFKVSTDTYNGVMSLFDSGNNEDVRLSALNGASSWINNGGNVGIGTSSPAAKLQVVDAASPTILVQDTTNNVQTIMSSLDTVGVVGTGTAHDLTIRTNNTERVRITSAGNLLVGNTNGTSRITASGVIESTTGGFKFPDGTTQTSAAVDPATVAAGAVGTYAMLVNDTTSGFNSGDVFTTSSYGQLTFAATSGRKGVFATVVPIGQTWMCMGLAEGTAVYPDAKDRTTLWLRIS